jgi:hypothetical protein
MKNYPSVLLAIIVIVLASCKGSDEDGTGVGDAIIIAKQKNTVTVYGLSLNASSYASFKSVTVSTATGSNKYTLKSNQGYPTDFIYETPVAEFSETKPAATTYLFSAIFENGATDEFEDVVTDKTLPTTSFKTSTFNSSTNVLDISWNLIENADSYALNIIDGSSVVFASPELTNKNSTYTISSTGGGWANGFTPQKGKTYTVRLYAFLYEPNLGNYNLQASSITETNVVWGQ